ncbi:MAG: acyl carrier protein [Deltaproteobacteria bacterium]|nr:acyl carrier protein [Deltaproteobacteria bacterium]
MPENRQRAPLVSEIAHLITESLNLQDVDPNEITEETSFFEEGLNLDSIDILEIVVGIEEKYGVKINSAEEGKKVFQKVGTVVDYIESRRG